MNGTKPIKRKTLQGVSFNNLHEGGNSLSRNGKKRMMLKKAHLSEKGKGGSRKNRQAGQDAHVIYRLSR